jgi:hypothetical protein
MFIKMFKNGDDEKYQKETVSSNPEIKTEDEKSLLESMQDILAKIDEITKS